MKNPRWDKAVQASADPARAGHFLELLAETEARRFLEQASSEQTRIVAAVLGGSQALGEVLVARPDWTTDLGLPVLRSPRRVEGLVQQVAGWLEELLAAQDHATALRRLREFKRREMLRIGARDLVRLSNVEEITREISDVADVCLEAVWRICRQQLETRVGCPFQTDYEGRPVPTEACVLGMGKLGGQELNYSSDVDVLFVYSDEGQVFRGPPSGKKRQRPVMSSHEFFNRLAESFVGEVARMTEEGMLYRIDLRLRPEGNSGPLTRSLASYENYYAQWGQTWERMMLIKARQVAGDRNVAGEFLETVQPFRFPRSIGEGALREVAALKDRIDTEVVRSGEEERNVKLGRGGIREIEFVVQSLQVLHAGRQPFLQISQTLPCLAKLSQYNILPEETSEQLRDAYCFLRDVEHRLQMEANLQTHTLPEAPEALNRLARLMGFKTVQAFDAELRRHTTNVRRTFEQLSGRTDSTESNEFPADFEESETQWRKVLEKHSFRDVDNALGVLREFVQGPGYVHVSPRTCQLARQLLPKLFGLCRQAGQEPEGGRLDKPVLSDPDRVLTRLASFVAAYGARATLFELWTRHPELFELLLLLFDRSEFLAELAIHTPDLVDDMVVSGRLRQRKNAPDTLRELMHGIGDKDQHRWIRRYQQAELMRIGLRDILGLAGPQQTLEEISALGDACLQYAVALACRQRRLKKPPFAVAGLGKLGGCELNYGSDLDVLFVAGDKARGLPKLQKMALEIMGLLSQRTELGLAFVTDARLRPDGEEGLLVNTLSAYEAYYRERAQLWELQAVSRVRIVAGDPKVGKQFTELVCRLTDFRRPDLPLTGYSSEWKQDMHRMRMRIEKERTRRGQNDLAIKTGKGGLMDAEFIAQALCLEHGWHEPNTLAALERALGTELLPLGEELIVNYLRLRRVEGILRRWSYEGESALPADEQPYERVSVRCGFTSPDLFRQSLASYREAVRKAYLEFFDVG